MLEQLLKVVQEQAQSAIVNNQNIPNEHNSAVTNEVMSAIQNGLSGAIQNGNLSDVMSLFSQGGNQQQISSNPIVNMISQNLISTLGQKFGINPQTAQSLVASILPSVLSKFSQQTADPNNSSIDMNTVISSLTGGKGAAGVDFNGLLNQFTGGQGGKVDIAGIAGQLLSNQGGNQGAGGILGTLTNLFGKK